MQGECMNVSFDNRKVISTFNIIVEVVDIVWKQKIQDNINLLSIYLIIMYVFI